MMILFLLLDGRKLKRFSAIPTVPIEVGYSVVQPRLWKNIQH